MSNPKRTVKGPDLTMARQLIESAAEDLPGTDVVMSREARQENVDIVVSRLRAALALLEV